MLLILMKKMMRWLGGLSFANCVTEACLFTVVHVIFAGISLQYSTTCGMLGWLEEKRDRGRARRCCCSGISLLNLRLLFPQAA